MSRLLIQESPLQILPSLAVKIGLNEAIVLQQLHYWLHPDHNHNIQEGVHWVYNSYEQWRRQFPFWSKETIKRTIHALERQNLIVSRQFNEDKFDHRKWYSINYETLQRLEDTQEQWDQDDPIEPTDVNDRSGQNDPIGQVKMSQSDGSDCYDHYKEQRLHSEMTTETPCARANVSQAMLMIWHQTFSTSPAVSLTLVRQTRLSMILSSHFNQDLKQWQQFCMRVRNSAFLQGQGSRGWRATLDWCVDEANLLKILEGNYDTPASTSASPPSEAESLRRSQVHIQSLGDPQHQQIAWGICAQLGTATYNSWFQNLALVHRDGRKIVLSVPTLFMRDYIATHYLKTLEQVVQPLYPGPQELTLVVQPTTTPSLVSPPLQELPTPHILDETKSTVSLRTPMLQIVKDIRKQWVQSQLEAHSCLKLTSQETYFPYSERQSS